MKKKKVIAVIIIVIALVVAMGMARAYFIKRYVKVDFEAPDRMIFYNWGQSCEITDEKAFEEFLFIAGRYHAQPRKNWMAGPDSFVDAAETDAAIANKFPGERVIQFAYEDNADTHEPGYDIYFFMDRHYAIEIPHISADMEPASVYGAYKLISEYDFHAYSKEMENAELKFGLYSMLE